MIKIDTVEVEKPAELNVILGQTHFIKSVEDIYEALVTAVPGIKFGLAFCEASGDCLIRSDGSDPKLVKLAEENAQKIGAGHSFIVFLRDCYPVNVLNAIKAVPEVCRIYAATANPLEVVIIEKGDSRGILGVIDGVKPKGIESEKDKEARKSFLRKIGYKR
ncbi:MAG: adenosine-specific kinase [Candidatus Altiarchaeota archaeon]|nr:adenosine-specific kinase [Candidatus Altiarchaeota archaeon]